MSGPHASLHSNCNALYEAFPTILPPNKSLLPSLPLAPMDMASSLVLSAWKTDVASGQSVNYPVSELIRTFQISQRFEL